MQPDRGFTHDLVQRAENAGYRALCVTADTPVFGARNREARARVVPPPGVERSNLKSLGTENRRDDWRPSEHEIFSPLLDQSLSWKDIEWLWSFSRVPVLLKGVLNPDDAEIALQAGISGLIVSNRGGRNLDTLPATIEALPAVADRVAGRIPILIDGGIRRGTDVLKGIALGATAVLIGRPYLYGLGIEGEAGVTRVVNIPVTAT